MVEAHTYREEAEALRAQVAALKVEVLRKEQANQAQKEKAKVCDAQGDNYQAQIGVLNGIVTKQESTIAKLSKPKRLAFGPAVGYGYSLGDSLQRTAFVGVSITYSIARF